MPSVATRDQLKCDCTRAETRFRLSAKRTSPFKSAWGASVQSTTGSRGVRISGSNAGYTMIRGSVKSTDYPLHSSVSPSLPLTCVAVCHHISAGLYHQNKHLPGAAHLQERYSRHRKGWPQKYLLTNALVRNSKILVIKYHSWQVIYFAYFLLDNSSASEFYMPTFRNTVCSICIPTRLWRWNRVFRNFGI
jgi:hypothetical protein